MPGKHAAIYARVSSKSQDLASQLPDLKRWAGAQEGPVEWYTDRATGTTMDRPGWASLWRAVLDNRVARVVVWRLDRLGRTARETVPLFHELTTRGVSLVSIREGFDLTTPGGRLFATMLAGFAQYETEVRSERQRAGIAEAKGRGVVFGRPKGPGKPIKVNDDKRAAILDLKSDGLSVAAIARVAGLSRTTVYAVLEGVDGG